ncbi:MAG TPA: hypothetical protein DCX80_11900 [Chloroflexi bacterium]|nr:hypothetical protein [Chloroflexota bacterium]
MVGEAVVALLVVGDALLVGVFSLLPPQAESVIVRRNVTRTTCVSRVALRIELLLSGGEWEPTTISLPADAPGLASNLWVRPIHHHVPATMFQLVGLTSCAVNEAQALAPIPKQCAPG